MPQLYNCAKDPQDLTDVADRYPSVAKDLQSKLERYIASGCSITNGSFNEKEA